MNAKEGLRRIGMVTGLLGAGVGALFSVSHYDEIQTTKEKRAAFEALVLTPLIQEEIAIVKVLAADKGPSPPLQPADNALIDKAVPSFDDLVKRSNAKAALSASMDGWAINKDSVEKINFDYMGSQKVVRIDRSDGRTDYETPAPDASEYLLLAIFPSIGFLLPWGIFKIVAWIVAGFSNV